MRILIVALSGLLASACTTLSVGPAETASQSELDRRAGETCDETPNTDEMLACRRRTQDSWREPPTGSPVSWPPRSNVREQSP